MIPAISPELLPFIIPPLALEGNALSDVDLDRTQVFRFPNNKGLSVTFNERGDAQIAALAWESYRITSVKLLGKPRVCTHAHAGEVLTQMFKVLFAEPIDARAQDAMRKDIAALMEVGAEERHESFDLAMSDDGWDDMPSDPSPTLDWATASLASLPRAEQDVVLSMLSKPGEREMCINSIEHYLRVDVRRCLEAGRIDDGVEFLMRLRDSHGVLAYDDMILAAANHDLVNDTRCTRKLFSAIAKRPDAYSMSDFLEYFSKSTAQATDVRYVTRVVEEAKAAGIEAVATGKYDPRNDCYRPREKDPYIGRGFTRASYEMFEGKPRTPLSTAPVNVTSLVAHIQKCYGKQGIDPFVGMGRLAESTDEHAQALYQQKHEQLLGHLGAMIERCEFKIALQNTAATLSAAEEITEHLNDIGSMQGIAPTVTLALLNSHLGEIMATNSRTIQEKVEWYIEKAYDIFLLGEMQYRPVEALLGTLAGWPNSLVQEAKQSLEQTWNNDFGRDSLQLS